MEIRIAKTSKQCAATGKAFVHDEEVVSLVKLRNQTYVREDYSKASWSVEHAQGAIAVWSTRFHDPKLEQAQPPEVFLPLRHVFYESVKTDARDELAVAYLAAQLLRRQKVFRLLKESDEELEGNRVTLFADRIGGRLIEVHDPAFTVAELDAGKEMLMERLEALKNAQAVVSDDGELRPYT